MVPFTSNAEPGAVVPIPTLPVLNTRRRSVLLVFVTKSTASVVPTKLVPATVPLLPTNAQAFAFTAGDISNGVEEIPLMVLVRLEPLNDKALVLIIGTVAPATPFTVVNKVLPLLVLLILFTIGTVAPTTPFTVVNKVFALLVLLTLFTAGAVADIPFTILVMVLTDELNVCEVVDAVDAQDNVPAPLVDYT